MPKPEHRAWSRHAREAAELLGREIREARLARAMPAGELAERAGVSRGLVRRVEAGDTGVSLGAAFELAALVGLPLFEPEPTAFARRLGAAREKAPLLPQAARPRRSLLKDDF
ncbi:helix-turn-helix transcriptional regulator [Salinarimonas sp. NSM]|uniref:helix-turn-helix transcriptional regulator n=1 Tax=Salinarimonas TaxID=690086 RepID=UPI0035562E6A